MTSLSTHNWRNFNILAMMLLTLLAIIDHLRVQYSNAILYINNSAMPESTKLIH